MRNSLLARAFRLRLRVRRLCAYWGEQDVPGESPGRQTIKEDAEYALGIAVDVGMTNFYVAAPIAAFPAERVGSMRWWFVNHDYR